MGDRLPDGLRGRGHWRECYGEQCRGSTSTNSCLFRFGTIMVRTFPSWPSPAAQSRHLWLNKLRLLRKTPLRATGAERMTGASSLTGLVCPHCSRTPFNAILNSSEERGDHEVPLTSRTKTDCRRVSSDGEAIRRSPAVAMQRFQIQSHFFSSCSSACSTKSSPQTCFPRVCTQRRRRDITELSSNWTSESEVSRKTTTRTIPYGLSRILANHRWG